MTVTYDEVLDAYAAALADALEHRLKDGEPCDHPGCLSHISHPCEGCGRVGGVLVRGVDTLTDAEKTQALLAAVLDGQRVEPFATFLDNGDAALKRLGIQARTLNETVRDGG